MDNDKSTALVSVQDLSAVLQGVKRYIDSSKPNVSWDELASSKTAYIPVELTWNEDEKLYIGNIWHNTSKVRVNGVEYDCPSFDFMGRPGYGNGNIAAWESNGFPFSYANFADGQVLVACKGNDSFLPINTFEFIVEQSSLCPQDYVESSLGNNTLREDIKFLKENSGKVTIDGLVKQEFGEVVSMEYYGMTMQGILTNIPAQEGVSFKLSNIHYEDDIHFYDTSLSEGTPEAVYAKDDANRVMHYPTELSGVLEYHQGALGYSEEFDSTGLHALVDFGLGYMVYVDNFGFELSLKPLISYPLKLEVSSLISPDFIDSSLGKANLREDLESLHLGKTTKWVDTKIAKVGSDAYAGIPWKDEYQYPKAIRYILDGVEIDSENLPEGNTLTIEPSDSFGINWMQIEVNGTPQFLYGDGSLAGVAGLLVLCSSDNFVLEKLELKVEICNTISSEFVDNMPYIGYNTISSGITEVEPNVTGLPYEKGLKLDATTFSGAISVNGEVFDITMTSGDGTLFGNMAILSGSYKEGDVPYVGMIGLDDDGKVLVIVGSMKPISSVELLQKEWRRKLPKEAIEGDDNESTDTFVAYNYLYLGNAHVEGNKLYIDNAEVVDNKIILN